MVQSKLNLSNFTTPIIALIIICTFELGQSEVSKLPSYSDGRLSIKPNKYVQSSPPCLAAVCRNGIALLALHSTNIQEERHIMKRDYDDSEVEEDILMFPDLPLASRCPLRIERLDGRGSALLTCGWRADGMILADIGRDLCREEVMRYGRRWEILNKNNCKSDDKNNYGNCSDGYGQWLGWGLVKQLVKYEAKDSVSSSKIGIALKRQKSI